MNSLLSAIWQSDSAFPSGSFAFSNGVEGAAALAGRLDRRKLFEIVAGSLRFRWATADRMALLHAFHAVEVTRLVTIDLAFEAATMPEPFRSGSRRNGSAFLIAHARLGTDGAAAFRDEIAAARARGHLPVAQGWIWRRCGLDQASALAASAYTVAAGLVNAAVRLGDVGTIEAQGALRDSLKLIGELDMPTFDPASELRFSSMTPWLDIATLRHAGSDLRLFSN